MTFYHIKFISFPRLSLFFFFLPISFYFLLLFVSVNTMRKRHDLTISNSSPSPDCLFFLLLATSFHPSSVAHGAGHRIKKEPDLCFTSNASSSPSSFPQLFSLLPLPVLWTGLLCLHVRTYKGRIHRSIYERIFGKLTNYDPRHTHQALTSSLTGRQRSKWPLPLMETRRK